VYNQNTPLLCRIRCILVLFVAIFTLIIVCHTLIYISLLTIRSCVNAILHSEYEVIIINGVSDLDSESIIESLKLDKSNALILPGSIENFYYVSLGLVKSRILIVIGHGGSNAIATVTEANTISYIAHGPFGLIGFIGTMYVPTDNKKYIALTLNFFKYLFNSQIDEIVIISCNVGEVVKVLRLKGYKVYVSQYPKPLFDIVELLEYDT